MQRAAALYPEQFGWSASVSDAAMFKSLVAQDKSTGAACPKDANRLMIQAGFHGCRIKTNFAGLYVLLFQNEKTKNEKPCNFYPHKLKQP